MILNTANLTTLFRGFKSAFNAGMGAANTEWSRVAMEVPSSTSREEYGWIDQVPSVREWVGDRHHRNVQSRDYTIKNRDWESTVDVPRPYIEDDQYGVFTPLFTQMGQSAVDHRSQLVFSLLAGGFDTTCYDGRNFFDTDHPSHDTDGVEVMIANTDGGSGTPWFLLDTSKAIKPLIFQNRKTAELVAKTDARTSEAVFERNLFTYGSYQRNNVGFGLWRLAWGSKQTLDPAHYAVARAALFSMKGDQGRPIRVVPDLLVVPPILEQAGREILMSERNAAGATNPWRGTAELLVTPWLV